MDKIFIFNPKLFKATLLAIIFIEFFSLYGFAYSFLNKAFFILIILATLYLAWKKLIYGVYIVLVELIIASKGYLFYLDFGEKVISIRIGIFITLMTVWIVKLLLELIKNKKVKSEFLKSKILPYFLPLFAFILWGIVWGVSRNNPSNAFFDFNGWLYFILIFPFFDAIKMNNINNLLNVFLAGVTGLILKTFLILFIFSHQFVHIIPEIYRWIRVTGVGEIADMGGGFYRIFFQSHVYGVLGFLILLPVLYKKFVHRKESIKKNYKFILLVVSIFSLIIISFSRSFWIGSLAAFFVFFATLLFIIKEKFSKILIGAITVSAVFLMSTIFIIFLIKVPVQVGQENVDFASAFKSRISDSSNEVAVSSRWNLISPLWGEIKNKPFLGSGFGSTVSYKTLDPRALQNNPDGVYTTYAFEWGYLDIWLKIGFFGLVSYILLILKVFKMGWDLKKKDIFFGSLLGLIALVIIHFFTPYLNHPLGIGYLLVLSVVYEKTTSQKDKIVVN
jgi:O-antigen ligase